MGSMVTSPPPSPCTLLPGNQADRNSRPAALAASNPKYFSAFLRDRPSITSIGQQTVYVQLRLRSDVHFSIRHHRHRESYNEPGFVAIVWGHRAVPKLIVQIR